MNGTESDMSGRARRFAASLARRSGRRVLMVDERLSSVAARDIRAASGHEAAAALIAETWLAEPHRGLPPEPSAQ